MANGTIAFDTLTTSDSVNTGTEKSIDTSYLFNAIPKLWVHFDGSATGAAAQDSFNLSSMTDNGTGDYTITIAVTMKNANYCFTVGVEQNTGQNTNNFGSKSGTAQTTTALTMSGGHEGGTLDFAEYCVSIQGDLA